jgi:hypothetical protein
MEQSPPSAVPSSEPESAPELEPELLPVPDPDPLPVSAPASLVAETGPPHADHESEAGTASSAKAVRKRRQVVLVLIPVSSVTPSFARGYTRRRERRGCNITGTADRASDTSGRHLGSRQWCSTSRWWSSRDVQMDIAAARSRQKG